MLRIIPDNDSKFEHILKFELNFRYIYLMNCFLM